MAENQAPLSVQALAARVRIKADRRLGRDTDPVIEQIANSGPDADPAEMRPSARPAFTPNPQRPAASS